MTSAFILIPILVHFFAILIKALMVDEGIFLFVNLKSLFKQEIYLFKSLVFL